MQVLKLWDDPENLPHYVSVNIVWTRPKEWVPNTPFAVPEKCLNKSGIYQIIRAHGNQSASRIISYIGKTVRFEQRLQPDHHMHDELVTRRGKTLVSCGVIDNAQLSGCRFSDELLLDIEDIIKFSVHSRLKNIQGWGSLPGFRNRTIRPVIITNSGSRGHLPRTICYPAFAVSWR